MAARPEEEHQLSSEHDQSVHESFPIPSGSRINQGPSDVLSEQEQKILAEIQDLQRQLWELKSADDEEQPQVGASNNQSDKGRLIMVSNRLPLVRHVDSKTHKVSYTLSSGGLVTALSGVRDELNFLWVGWLGTEVPPEEQAGVRQQLLAEHNCLPVFLPDNLVKQYYNGFSNDVLWPLFHYVPLPMYKAGSERKFDTEQWEAYQVVNRIFAVTILEQYLPDDILWIHDYHLMCLPLELRKREPKCKVAWFLHTPFPTSEIYRILPVRDQLLNGLLQADLCGFQTYDYARHFLSSCARVLEVETSPKGIEYNNHYCAVGVYPIGVDPDYIRTVCKSSKVARRVQELRETFAGRKILLGVDRLDYIKGMPHKLLGLELFLARHPEWRGKVTLIQVGVPTREGVAEYQKLGQQVNELVGRINGTHGTLEYSPIHYINQSVPQDELFAIYQMADVCLVTSVRDGMNLVSHEYVVAQEVKAEIQAEEGSGPGVLVLSEFAGSAQSLSGALRVNPWNTEELESAINTALTLSPFERQIKQDKLYQYVSTHTASYWAKSFLSEFKALMQSKPDTAKNPRLRINSLVHSYQYSQRRLIVFDYDGTLTPVQPLPQLAQPTPHLIDSLKTLSNDPRNLVFVMTSRERKFLDLWLGHLYIGLAAEDGFYHRMPGEKDWQTIGEKIDSSWKEIVQPIMRYFSERTPGTYIETKENSITWNYKDADPHFGAWQAKDMQLSLEDVLSNSPLEIVQGRHTVEVRHRAVAKAKVLERVLDSMKVQAAAQEEKEQAPEVDFIFCVGDDRSDEGMFQFLSRWKEKYEADLETESTSKDGSTTMKQQHRRVPAIYTVHIGNDPTQARAHVESPAELKKVLRAFVTVSKKDKEISDILIPEETDKKRRGSKPRASRR